ncbi:hypothetical protein D4764_0180610 [Takifugu flavidus]|uniref:Uncharacterized protein n=1 Tax=Takifugu flavidus TaxID=433684 RepID=A0A5C6MGV6_9TELE|nr:hypothetical protein D4764_0180610 [Takifugu flavidus]
MENDFRTASKGCWTTIRRLRKGKQCTVNAVYCGDGVLLTSTRDVVDRWKEYFEDLLNPTNTPSSEEVGPGDLGIGSHISGAEVAEVVKKPLGGKAPGVDEIHPEFLKALDVVVLSWLTRLCNIAWTSGAGIGRPGWRVCRIVEPRIQDEQCGFCPGRGTVDQLYTLSRVLEGAWEFAQQVHMCFVDLEKPFDRVPRGVLWGVLREYGVSGPLIRAVYSLYDRCQSLVRIAGNDVVLLASSARDLQLSLDRFAATCEAAGIKISTSKSEAMVLNRKKMELLLRDKEEILLQVEEFKYLGVFFTSEGRMEQEIDRRISVASAVMRTLHRSVVVKRELSRKAERTRSRVQAAEMSFLRRVAGLFLRDRLGCPLDASLVRRPLGRPRTHWRDYVSRLVWERLGIPPDELEEVAGEREVWASLLRLLPPRPDPG